MNKYFYIFLWLLLFFISFGATAQLQNSAGATSSNLEEGIERESILLPWEDVNKRIKENMFVKVETNKKQCFIGEPLLVTYKLYTRLQSHSSVVDAPTFTGCSVVEMTTNEQKEEDVTLNGKPFRTYIIRKVQLFPLQEGALQLGCATLDNEVEFYRKQTAGYQNITQKVKLTNDPVSVQVVPLPSDSAQHLFTGVVGKFFIIAKVSKTVDTANDNNSLELKITGNGNFMNMVCPTVVWPSTIQGFEPQSSELLDKLSFPVLGQKVFNIPFTCKKVGEAIIPAITFTYFDVETKKYVSSVTDSIHITVKPEIPLIDESKLSPEITNIQYLWIIPVLAGVVGLVFLLFSVKKKKVSSIDSETVVAETSVEGAKKVDYESQLSALVFIQDRKIFYTEAKELALALKETSVNEIEAESLTRLISLCNEALYAPIESNKELIVNTLQEIIQLRNNI